MLLGVLSIIGCVGLLKDQTWGVYMTIIVAAIGSSILIFPPLDFGLVPIVESVALTTYLAVFPAFASAITWFVGLFFHNTEIELPKILRLPDQT